VTTALKQAFEKAAELPPSEQDAFAQFLLDELEFVSAVEAGIDAADHGEVHSVEEVRKMVPGWISESSSRNRR
jgi:predicted transcriptional regulator